MLLDIMSLTHSITEKGQDIPMYHANKRNIRASYL